jgi:hypothetical protein
MDKCIDIYSRLMIATITFVVPIIINLLSTFTEGEKRRKALAKEIAAELDTTALKKIQANPENTRKTISETHKQYQEIEKRTNSKLLLLNPLAQFLRIFIALAFSFLLLVFNYLIRSDYWNLYNHTLSIFTLIFSLMAYCIGLFFIIRILYTISETKKIIDK